jgi:hypothetical protein
VISVRVVVDGIKVLVAFGALLNAFPILLRPLRFVGVVSSAVLKFES